MADVAKSSNQNYLPVQAYFNLDGTFNTFIGQGQPFVISATESIGINNTTVNTTVYPTFTSVTSGQITALSITSSALSFNPSTGILSSTGFSGALSGTATTATNIAGGIASQIPYQTANGQTAFISNGANGQVLTSNGTSVPSWQNATSNINVTDDTSSLTTEYVTLARVTTGSISTLYTSSSKLSYVSQTGTLSATTFNGALASSNLTGTTLPSSIVTSSLTSVGTITSGVWNGTAIGNTYLANSSITINGNSVSLGGSTTVTANTTNALTIGTGLTGTSFNGSTAVTVAIDTGVVATLTGTQTLTNKTISGSTNTLTNIANGSLTNSAITINGTSTSLGGSINVGTVTSVSATAGTGISITGSPITSSGTLNITNTAPDQIVSLTGSGSTTVTGTYPNFTISSTGGGGSVAGSNTQIQYNNSGAFGANANFTYTGNDVNIPFGPSNSATSVAKIALFLSLIN